MQQIYLNFEDASPKFPIKQALQKVDLEDAGPNECYRFKHCLMDCSLAHSIINCNIIIT